MHKKYFILVVKGADELVRDFGEGVDFLALTQLECESRRARERHLRVCSQHRGDCCDLSFWCRAATSIPRWLAIAVPIVTAFAGIVGKHYWG